MDEPVDPPPEERVTNLSKDEITALRTAQAMVGDVVLGFMTIITPIAIAAVLSEHVCNLLVHHGMDKEQRVAYFALLEQECDRVEEVYKQQAKDREKNLPDTLGKPGRN